MNGQRPNGQRRPTNRPRGTQPPAQKRSGVRPQNIEDALNERYEEMVSPSSRADSINRGKYADLSTFESKGHRKIDPAVMRAKRQKEFIRKCIPVCAVAIVAGVALWVYFGVMRPAAKYDEAVAFFEKEDYSSAADIFERLDDYKETGRYMAYIDARTAYKSGDYNTAKVLFDSLDGFYDSGDMAGKAEQALLSASEPDDSAQQDDYAAALELLEKGDYEGAKAAFEALGDYSDSAKKAQLAQNEIDYAHALQLLSAGDKEGAKEIFLSLGDFRDSAEQLLSLDAPDQPDDRAQKYAEALAAMDENDYREANNIFNELGDYSDSKTYADYTYAVLCYNNGDYATAVTCFEACGDFLDSADRVYDAKYQFAVDIYQMADSSKLPEVIALFTELGDYSDSADMLYAAKEQYREVGIHARNGGDLELALEIFESLGDYSDCAELAEEVRNEIG